MDDSKLTGAGRDQATPEWENPQQTRSHAQQKQRAAIVWSSQGDGPIGKLAHASRRLVRNEQGPFAIGIVHPAERAVQPGSRRSLRRWLACRFRSTLKSAGFSVALWMLGAPLSLKVTIHTVASVAAGARHRCC